MYRLFPYRSAIRRSELPLALLMFSYFLLVITSFWILKPVKKALFIEFYDNQPLEILGWKLAAAQAELLAKILNMIVAFAAVVVFTWLVRWFRRQKLTFIFTSFFLASYLLYTLQINHPGHLTVWTFYLFGDLFSTLMVATFFSFLNDSVSPDTAKRLYGFVGLGGVIGGVLGTTVVRVLIRSLQPASWLWICFLLGLLIILVAFLAGRLVEKNRPANHEGENGGNSVSSGIDATKHSPFTEGGMFVFRSKYLLSIGGIVFFYEIVSTVLDFQFTSTVTHYLDGPDIGEHFATVFTITNVVSLLVQVFLTSFVMTRFGVGVALLVLPSVTLLGSAAFLALPTLWIGSFLNTADNGFSYSINQSAKEALYVPTSPEGKYKAKAFIDMFLQRFAKVVAVFTVLGMSGMFADFSRVRWLTLVTTAVIGLWILIARYAGMHFSELAEQQGGQRLIRK